MFFLNLTAAEFFTLFAALGGLITALYLLDRSKRKKVVSTLRFWTPARTAEERQSRRRMHDPWSLLLQLAGLVLLLLAIAQLQWGSRERRGRDHVLLLDTSAWSAQQQPPDGTLLDREKAIAQRYLAALPSVDRVMLVRADSLAAPLTPFTANRAQLSAAIRDSTSTFSALNLEQALSFARQAQSWSGGRAGEIVYIGARLAADEPPSLDKIPNLRTISVEPSRENVGIRRLGVRRSEEDSADWQATVTLKNYGALRRAVRLRVQFAGTVFKPRTLNLSPGEEAVAEYGFVTNTAGELIAEITPHDSLPSDDHALLQLPKNGSLRLAVFTLRPAVLRPLFLANHRLMVRFYSPAQFQLASRDPADVFVFDQCAPAPRPKIPSLWIDPPREGSPLPVKALAPDAVIKSWHDETALGDGLHSTDRHLAEAEVLETFDGDIPVASTAAGTIVAARPATKTDPKLAVIGFDPLGGELKFEITTPLLFANLLRWLAPDAFRTLDLSAGHVGTAAIALDPHERLDRLRVTDSRGFAVPFTVRAQTLQLFAGAPSTIHILSGDRERVVSLTLPDLAEFAWHPPAGTARDLPPSRHFAPAALDLWKWLAILGAACLLAEWFLYGRERVFKFRRPVQAPRFPAPRPVREPQPEVVTK